MVLQKSLTSLVIQLTDYYFGIAVDKSRTFSEVRDYKIRSLGTSGSLDTFVILAVVVATVFIVVVCL